MPFDRFGNYPYQPVYNGIKRVAQTGEIPYWEQQPQTTDLRPQAEKAEKKTDERTHNPSGG